MAEDDTGVIDPLPHNFAALLLCAFLASSASLQTGKKVRFNAFSQYLALPLCHRHRRRPPPGEAVAGGLLAEISVKCGGERYSEVRK